MSETCRSSIHALAQAMLEELARAEGNSRHGAIRISHDAKFHRNGIRYCSVQIECRMGCGWLIEASDGEAEELHQKAIAIQRILEGSAKEALKSLAEILLAVFPEFVLERKAAMPKGTKESKLGGS